MKILISSLLFFTLSISFLIAEVSTWDQNSAYTKGDIAIYSDKNYVALQNVPAGTPVTSSAYWQDIDETMPELAKNNEIPAGLDTVASTTPDISEIANLTTPDTNTTASTTDIRLKGISTNATVTPSALMVAGVTVTGGTKKVVFQVQATGTYAATDGYLQDPVLYIVNAVGAVIATVDNWQNGPDAGYDASLYSPSYLTELQNSAYAMSGANEAAIIMNLPEGSYTALVGSKSGTETAKAVVAAFDFETGATLSSLKGISTNATVTPSALMVAGVTVTGGTKKVVFQVQATGTYAATDGYLQDPVLYIVNAVGAVIATVDNWQNGPDAGYDATLYSSSYLTDLQNSAYAMTGANEAAIIMNLPEGSYTALVGSKSGTETAKAVVAAFDFE